MRLHFFCRLSGFYSASIFRIEVSRSVECSCTYIGFGPTHPEGKDGPDPQRHFTYIYILMCMSVYRRGLDCYLNVLTTYRS
jgi:hypothetical protein